MSDPARRLPSRPRPPDDQECHTRYHTFVLKTTLYLPDGLKHDLARLAKERGTSEAELIRQAIARLVGAEQRPRPTAPLFRSGDPTLAERVDDALTGFGS